MSDEQVKKFANSVVNLAYQSLVSQTRINRVACKVMAVNIGNRAAQSLELELKENLSHETGTEDSNA